MIDQSQNITGRSNPYTTGRRMYHYVHHPVLLQIVLHLRYLKKYEVFADLI